MGSIGPPPKTRGVITKKGSSPLHFLRVLRYAKPFMRYLYPALACVVVVALTYSLNLVALMPAVKVVADEQGIPAWTHQYIAESRLGLTLIDREQRLRVVKIEPSSPLSGRLGEWQSLSLKTVNDQGGVTADLLEAMAGAPDGEAMRVGFIRDGAEAAVEVSVVPGSVSLLMRQARTVVGWLPVGDSIDAKWNTLIIILVTVLAIGVFGAACRFFGEYLIALVAGRTVVALRRQMYERVLRLPVSYYATHGVSDLVSRFVQDSQDIYRGLNFVFAKSLREPLKAMFVFAAALMLDPAVTMIAVISAPLAGLLIRKFGRMIRRANRRLLEQYGRMLAALNGALQGIRVVKGYGMERYERRHLFSVDQQMLKQQLRIARVEALSSPVFEVIGRIAATFAVLYFADQMLNDHMSFSKFATLGACMAGMFDPIRKMSSFYNKMQRANAALDRVFEIIDLPVQDEESEHKPALPSMQETIEFRDIVFTYPGADRPALDGVSLTVNRGERVAFVGPNGCGKTTLLSLLMRFFDPGSGEILFDGRSVHAHSLASLRSQMSLITQDTVIFADTIANNIAYGDDRLLRQAVLASRHPDRNYRFESSEQRIIEAAKAAHADEFIREKPDAYDTMVGEHGATLSGGQKQRLAIARAVLRNAPIFIFDEATSQVDADSEQKIHDAVEHFLEDRTALIISHRSSTFRQADRIIVMDKGRVLDSGTHDALMGRCDLYRSLYSSQTGEAIRPPMASA